jgi:hypothetical protein
MVDEAHRDRDLVLRCHGLHPAGGERRLGEPALPVELLAVSLTDHSTTDHRHTVT